MLVRESTFQNHNTHAYIIRIEIATGKRPVAHTGQVDFGKVGPSSCNSLMPFI